MKNRAHLRMSPLIASLSAAAVIGALFIPAAAATSTPTVATALPPGQVRVVDPDVTPATASLFNYLQDVRGKATLFGHQHTTSFGVTIGTADGTTSDVKNGVGDFPAIFGWDTLILQGDERPGQAANTTDQNIAAFADYIQKADTIGGISTISAHMENFVTGGSFYDTTGDTLRAVLPGGAKHDALKAYLDNIATLAGSIHDADGNLIPIIFRPWHENAGSWFWWGAAYGSPGEYAELYGSPSSTCATSRACTTSCTRSPRAAGSVVTPTPTCARTPATPTSTSWVMTATTTARPAPHGSTAWSPTSA